MKKLLTLFVALIATCALWASNVITYTASEKLTETTSTSSSSGLHVNSFNVSITSHTFADGVGTITFSGDVTSIESAAFYECYSLTSLTIPEGVTGIGMYAFYGCSSLTSIAIPEGVMYIGQEAFYYCTSLTSITIPESVTLIANSFVGCTSLTSLTWNAINCKDSPLGDERTQITELTIGKQVTRITSDQFAGYTYLADIYCYATVPPVVDKNGFDRLSKYVYIHIPTGTTHAYQIAPEWRNFYYYYEMSALPEGSETDKVGVTVTENYATFTWPVNPIASSYTLGITKDGKVFCTLVFNNFGQLVSMHFAPGRNGNHKAPAAETTAYGFSFVVTGLEDNSEYNFSMTTMDANHEVIAVEEGSFTTGTATAIEESVNVLVNTPTKTLRDGQLLITRDGKTYNMQGVRL